MVRFINLSLNEKGRFLWSAHRITEKQKAGKARNIKGKQLKNSRNMASRPHGVRRSSASVKNPQTPDAATVSGVFLLKQSDKISLILALFLRVK